MLSPLLAASNNAALITFLIYMVGVFALAWAANRLLQEKEFLSEYFLGSRSLGVWAFALTFAATSASGGSFMGFPSSNKELARRSRGASAAFCPPRIGYAMCSFTYSKSPGLLSIPTFGGAIQLAYFPGS